MNFLFFLHVEFRQIIIELNGNHGLHEQRLACGRPVMHDAVEPVSVLRLYGNDIAPAALGNQRILKI